jgi:diguanylate cyclase (GGDEF)-like protein
MVAVPDPPIIQSTTRVAYLVVIYGDELGKRIEIGDGGLEAGRGAQCAIPINHDSVSRRHAQFWWDGTCYRVRDLGSTNGTHVNDIRVTDQGLADGDRIKIGPAIFKFMSGADVESSYHEEVYRMMTVDGLTCVYNKRYFNETFEREMARCRRYQRDLALVLFDIDHFKRKNDTYGHLAGDTILRDLAAAVGTTLRCNDVFARVGGEEFAVLAPEVSMSGARDMADKIGRTVASATFRFEEHVIPTTVSLGVAIWLGHDDTPEQLYKRADAALYSAKQMGRNRVVCS